MHANRRFMTVKPPGFTQENERQTKGEKLSEEKKPTHRFCSPRPNFREKLLNYSKNGISYDSEFIVDGRTFKVTKGIFMTQSSVFEDMFTSGMKEARENKVVIKNVSHDVFEAFVEYIYLKKTSKMSEFDEQLYVLGEKYSVHKLQVDCVWSMKKTTTKANIVNRIKLAFKYKEAEFKKTVLQLVSNDDEMNFCHVCKSTEWIDFLKANTEFSQNITSEVFSYVAKRTTVQK